MKLRVSVVAGVCAALAASTQTAAGGASRAPAMSAPQYYVALGDSLAASYQPNGDLTHGYVEQLYASLAAHRKNLRLVKLGRPGESTASMRWGAQDPTRVLSCATPAGSKQRYRHGTQLAEAVSFLKAHEGKVALVTSDIGGNDLQHLDAEGHVVFCPLTRVGCSRNTTAMARNLRAILSQLEAAAGPQVPIAGMSYDDVIAGLCASSPGRRGPCRRMDAFNRILVSTYAHARLPVADVAAAFGNTNLAKAAGRVCAWTWYCSRRDFHPNIAGYHVIARAFEHVVRSHAR